MRYGVISLLVIAVASSGCATTEGTGDPRDPYEPMNRTFFAFNDTLDKAIADPIAEAYLKLPEPARHATFNFFDNLGYAETIVNQFLQGKVERGFDDVGRFVINSTFGLGGLIDFAGGIGIARHDEDFGQTLGVWGVEDGPYLELPLFGPSSARDVWSIPAGIGLSALYYIDDDYAFPMGLVERVDARARLDSAIEIRDETALDPYAYQREAYLQKRRSSVWDGNPPLEDLDILEGQQ